MNKFTFTLSYEEKIKTNIVHLDELYNFVVQNFFIWINLLLQNMLWKFLCRVSKNNTRQRGSLPSVKKTLSKGGFAECPKKNTRQTTWHSAKSRSPVVCCRLYHMRVHDSTSGRQKSSQHSNFFTSLAFLFFRIKYFTPIVDQAISPITRRFEQYQDY